MARSGWATFGAVFLVLVMVGSALIVLESAPTSSSQLTQVSPLTANPSNQPSNSGANPGGPSTSVGIAGQSGSVSNAKVLGINTALAAVIKADQQKFVANGGNPTAFHPPNLHQAPPLTDTHGVVTPLYYVAPAPMGVAYYGLSNTTGTIQGTTVNTSSLAGTWNTSDPIGTAAELFDTSSGNSAGAFGAQLNSVLVNVTLEGQTSFSANGNTPSYGCGNISVPASCPNEFWLQNYIEYTQSTHTLQIGDEIWNFSNPTADWASSQSSGRNTITGFGSVQSGELYALSGSGYAFSLTIAPPFTLALYDNYTQGPCHTDSTPGTGVPTCGVVSATEPNNELFMNYSIYNPTTGKYVCPTAEPTGRVCGEYDDVFFNSVGASNSATGVPVTGPNGRVGSATIQANGTAYDPVGLTNDFEFDYGIGSDDGATDNIVYQDGLVGINYCQNANVAYTVHGAIKCNSYSATPAAVDFGGETGETSTGEAAYWTAQGSQFASIPGPTLLRGAATPITHLVTGPALLVGLWNMTGTAYTGAAPFPAYMGDEPLSYLNIQPANAWVGIARDPAPGIEVTNQSEFQVAPTFGFYSYWKGSGGWGPGTTLGANLYLPTGWYTLEVLLSGYTPAVGQIDLTGPLAPSITLTPNFSTGAYTPDWAFSNSDLANLSVSSSSSVPNGAGTPLSPYLISAGTPNVGSVTCGTFNFLPVTCVLGETGSVSWLFSNLNDYLFTQWIGGFVNSTTAVTQFNPAPSFPMDYPSWQLGALAEFNVPSVDGLQYYLLNTQNLAVIGATDIYSWANSEATTLYSFVVNNGANDLIADDSFHVSNRGLDFTGGGTTSTFTINGAPVTPTLKPARNFVWGNTFLPHPQSSYTGLEPFTAQDSLTLGEAFDRIYNNAFEANGTINSTANAASADTSFWNATCVGGYNALSAPTYPGPTACEPLSYSQTLDGYTMTGSIVASTYQGGNFWAVYGNEPNPYANIPVKVRLTTMTGTSEIASTTAPFAGDYAPLITTTVYDPTFTETGLPSSATATTFSVQILGGSGHPLMWLNTSATSATPAGCSAATICVKFYVPNGTYEFKVLTATISSIVYYPNPALTPFTVSGVPLGNIAISFGVGQTVTFTESGLPASTPWYVNITGQAPLTSSTTTIIATLSSGTYAFTAASGNRSYEAGYTSPFTVTSSAVPVSVTFALLLTAPIAPGVSATAIDSDQTLTVSGTIPLTGITTYSWVWLASSNGGSYGVTTQCAINSGSGASAGASVTCTISGGALTAGDSYSFELKVTDSANTPAMQTSLPSAAVAVASELTAPDAPTVTATALDVDQSLTVSGTIPSSGTATYAWAWLASTNGGAYAAATQCLFDSGAGASGRATIMCAVSGGTLTIGDTYSFELQVTDSATVSESETSLASSTVTVASTLTAPGAPGVSATGLDVDQALTVSGTIPSTGASPYAWTWLVSVSGGSYGPSSQCTSNSGTGASAGASVTCATLANTLIVSDTYTFRLQVSDGATVAETQTSTASSTVTVASALTAPGVPTVSATALDVDQALTVMGTIPTTGDPAYAWMWLVSVDGGSYGAATQCTTNSGTGDSAGATVTCAIPGSTLTVGDDYAFELAVTDGASIAQAQTSDASSAAAVASTLTTPATPTTSAAALDVDQTLTVSGTIPSTGTSPYAWEWQVSVNGGSYGTSTVCATNSGTGAPSGGTVSCVISGGMLTVGQSYAFELMVGDGATVAETQTSSASSAVTVASALTAPGTPTVSATALDVDQVLTVTGTVPSSGTSSYAWQWMVSVNGASSVDATQCTTNGGTGASGAATITCTVLGGTLTAGDTYAFELAVTDSATAPESQTSTASSTVTVASSLTTPGTPGVSAPKLDVDQSVTVTGVIPSTGTSSYGWEWLVSVNGGSYGAATQCAIDSGAAASAGATVTCLIAGSTLTAGDTYVFELVVSDSATTAQTTTSPPSAAVHVASALTAPAAPSVNRPALDVNQALTVTGKVPTTGTSTYAWEWMVSVNGGAFGAATQCSANSGTGAASGATVTCSIAGSQLTVGNTYAFKLEVSDGATVAETQTSSASPLVTVASKLTAPATPSLSATALDVDQTLTVTGRIPSTGTGPYAWEWMVSVDGGTYAAATQCATNNGVGASAGATVTCSIAGHALTAGDHYNFKLTVADSATVPETANSAATSQVKVKSELAVPAKPTVSSTHLVVTAALTVTGKLPSTGTSTFAWEWLVSVNGGAYVAATQCTVNSGTGGSSGATVTCSIAGSTLTIGDTYSFELKVTDSATAPETVTSVASKTVTVVV